MAVVTGTRIVFAAGDDRNDGSGSLEYADLATVQTGDDQVMFTTCEGVRCEIPLPEDESGAAETCAHLRWVGTIRSDVVSSRTDVDIAVGEIHDHASAMEWEKAETKYAEMRGTLDDLIVRLDLAPVPTSALAPEITELERVLEGAYVRMLIDRAESGLELADQLLGNGDYDRVQSVLRDVERRHDRARSHTAALERPDSFRFGEQREIFAHLTGVAETLASLREIAGENDTHTDGYKPVNNFDPPWGRISSRSYSRQYQPDDESGARQEGSRDPEQEAPPEMVTNGPAPAPRIEGAASNDGESQVSGDAPSRGSDSDTRATDRVINQLTEAIRRSGAETE
ncbi:MAG: hypothetical protein V5A39_07425 [Haloarculaceae archaeon]